MKDIVPKILYYTFHLWELYSIVRWLVGHRPVYRRDESKESPNLKECYRLLSLTSRSFVAVVQEVHTELLVPICVFYLCLRGLDTVEDDMTMDIKEKEPLLRSFHTHVGDEDWTYDGSGPDEKDREVLVKFDCVSREFNKIKKAYQVIIRDITEKMGNGMADYAVSVDSDDFGQGSVKTIKAYELYCHYVAGLVGEGLTQMFVEAQLVDPILLQRPHLMESMSQHLQQVNIIRDIREDYDDSRCFWPKEVWSKYVDDDGDFGDLFLPQNGNKALQCSSEMVLMALRRTEECLTYMESVTDQSVFNFVAIPQSMAIATLELCFQNPAIFSRNIKITRGEACHIMTESTQDFRRVCELFRRYARRIDRKNNNNPKDPHFIDIKTVCNSIDRFVDSRFPTPSVARADAKHSAHWVLAVVISGVTIGAAALAFGVCSGNLRKSPVHKGLGEL